MKNRKLSKEDFNEEEWSNLVGFFELLIEIDRERHIVKKIV